MQLQFEDEVPIAPEPAIAPAPAESEESSKVERALVTPELVIPSAGAVPEWAIIPEGFKFPRGRQIVFMRFLAAWTDVPGKGDRQIACWVISAGDRKLALSRAQGDANRSVEEMTKQMIRLVDGKPVDWSKASTSPEILWAEIGEKCRSLVTRTFLRLHQLDADEMRTFLEDCIAVVSAG